MTLCSILEFFSFLYRLRIGVLSASLASVGSRSRFFGRCENLVCSAEALLPTLPVPYDARIHETIAAGAVDLQRLRQGQGDRDEPCTEFCMRGPLGLR